MNCYIRISIPLLFLLITASTQAAPAGKNLSGMYKWIDASGRVHYSSVVPPEASKNRIDRLERDGRIHEISEAEISDEQRSLRKIKAMTEERVVKAKKLEDIRYQAIQDRYESIEELKKDIKKSELSWKEKISPYSQRMLAVESHIETNLSNNGSKLELAELRKEHENILSQLLLIKSESDLQITKMKEDLLLWERKTSNQQRSQKLGK